MTLLTVPTTSLSCLPTPIPQSQLRIYFRIPNQRASLHPAANAVTSRRCYPLVPPWRRAAWDHSSSLVGKWRCSAGDESEPTSQPQGSSGLDWPILERWDVPWEWPTLSLTFLACGLSFALTGLVSMSALPYLGLRIEELSLDEKAEILLLDQGITTAAVLAVLYGITGTFKPLPEDIFRYDLRGPFDLRRGWLLWAGVGLGGAVLAIALVGVTSSIFRGDNPERETDSLVRLLPLIGSSGASTACLVAITGVLAPLLEETVFRGFFMVSLTKWVPTPVAVLISAAVFALAHLTPGEFPQLFVLGTALGLIYAQTRNLLAPITVHSLWNSGVILVLTFLQLQGYDIRELLQAN